jgi:hypothetical protein
MFEPIIPPFVISEKPNQKHHEGFYNQRVSDMKNYMK